MNPYDTVYAIALASGHAVALSPADWLLYRADTGESLQEVTDHFTGEAVMLRRSLAGVTLVVRCTMTRARELMAGLTMDEADEPGEGSPW